MKQTFLSGATLAALVMLVALPLVFILLQAIFPHFSAGSLGDAFGGIPALLADPQLPAMLGGTLWIAAGVALVSVMIGLPLGILRGMFSLPLPRLWDLLFLIPFLTPPYISALSWMLALQSQGYLQQLTGWQLNDLLFSRSGIVLVMTFNIFPVVYFAVSRSLLASGTRLAVVARVHGASAWRAFWHVTLPMLSPALAAGMLLAFTLAIEEFGVPAVLANPPQMPPRTHRLLLVEVAGERWIADVGFGGQTLTAPIKLLADIPQQTPHGSYRLVHEGDEWTLQFNHHEHWQSMYHFDLGRQYASDYVMGNFWSAHWPQSHFRHHLLMCRHLPDGGKMTLTNFHFTHWENNHVVEKVDFADVSALYEALQTRFGLGVDDPKHGFSEAALAAVMAAFDTHPEAGK
nr:arylamine N-acetyltransferase [Klebsiella pneumoniae]